MLNLEKYQVQIAQEVTIHKYMLPHQNYLCSNQIYAKQKEGLAIGAPKSTLILKIFTKVIKYQNICFIKEK
jgi:hypothetical protein